MLTNLKTFGAEMFSLVWHIVSALRQTNLVPWFGSYYVSCLVTKFHTLHRLLPRYRQNLSIYSTILSFTNAIWWRCFSVNVIHQPSLVSCLYVHACLLACVRVCVRSSAGLLSLKRSSLDSTICEYTATYIYIYIYICLSVPVCMHACLYLCIYLYVCLCLLVYIYIYIYILEYLYMCKYT